MSLLLFSCEKDEDRITISTEGAPALTASATTLVLTQENGGEEAVKFSWSPLNLKWSQSDVAYNAVKYTLQLSPKGSNFATLTEVLADTVEKTFTESELNAVLTKLELPAEAAAQVDVRVKATYGGNVEAVYSAPVTLTVTPYKDIPVYPSLYVPGGYQGWSPDVAPRISSAKDDQKYEGFVNFQEASEFKFTSAPNWNNTNYGTGGAGKLSTTGDNLKVEEPGYYLLKADTKGLTWEAIKTAWGVVGDATGSWDVDKDLTYDATEKVWKATLPLTAGEIKFRANDKWDINLGDEKDDRPADGVLEFGSDNIKIEEAGTYEITLDLSNPAYYLYKLKKQ
ncbi:SusE domain-containing protein [Pontibacter ruber]|uniref:SusE domain-containing protein n=1 Tax=Pontibacter ruber TaxID=1343895 RepID=A0ABW5CUA6_9BACT|nr:SusE domain-containing protein [Pontibacter ruber]